MPDLQLYTLVTPLTQIECHHIVLLQYPHTNKILSLTCKPDTLPTLLSKRLSLPFYREDGIPIATVLEQSIKPIAKYYRREFRHKTETAQRIIASLSNAVELE